MTDTPTPDTGPLDENGPFLVPEGAEGLEPIALATAPTVVGRGAQADLRIPDRSLSGVHCRFEPVDGGWKVVDLDSRNGTFVNDVLVKQRLLEDGDRVRLGRVTLRYVAGDPAAREERELLGEVSRLASRIHKSLGKGGLAKARDRLVDTCSRRGIAPSENASTAEHDLHATRRLQAVVSAMIDERRPQAIFDLILDAMIEFTGAERGFVILVGDPKGETPAAPDAERRVVAARNLDKEEVLDAQAKISRTVERRTLQTGDPVIVLDASADERFTDTASVASMRLRSILAVPIRGRAAPVGLIYLDNRFERGVFEERHLPWIRMFADQAAIALRNAALHEESDARLEELAQAKEEVEELNRILADRVARTSAELQEVKGHVLRERAEAPLKYSYGNIVGQARAMQDLFHLLDKVTDSDVPVLIEGESGTGKELVARAIHFNGPRKDQAFVSENCAAIPETLLESELFGYMRGAFTGATADKKGLFEAANGGTLFLDEIGDMALEMQKKLLRVLQEREVRPVGGKRAVPIDVRILAASNQNLRKLCSEGKFREDLFYRLNVINVELPPLRDRREDIPLLVEKFLADFASSNRGGERTVSEDAMRALVGYRWPGNVRELRNEVQRAAALSDKVIVPLVLSPGIRGQADEPPVVADLGEKPLKDMVKDVTEDLEKRVIVAALRRSRGRKAQAARLLGISRPTLDAKIDAYRLEVKRD
jgi:transcriptional regulator with GAF, ATPase, and Fis domain